MDSGIVAAATPQALSTTNQIQLATLMAAHYAAARSSVDDWLRRRDQYLMLYITGAATTIGLYISRPGTPSLILFVVPALSIVILCAYLSADFHVAFLCKWLKLEYTALLEKLVRTYGVVSLAPWHWDNSASLSEFYALGVGRLRYVFLALTFVIANLAAPMVAGVVSGEVPPGLLAGSLGALLVCCGVLMFTYKKRKAMAQRPLYGS